MVVLDHFSRVRSVPKHPGLLRVVFQPIHHVVGAVIEKRISNDPPRSQRVIGPAYRIRDGSRRRCCSNASRAKSADDVCFRPVKLIHLIDTMPVCL